MEQHHNTKTLPQAKVPTTLRLTPDVYEALRDRAHESRTTQSAVVEKLLREYFFQQKAAA